MLREYSLYSQQDVEHASVSLESRKLPDVYPYLYVNGRLISPFNGLPVENSMARNNYVDEQDWIAFQNIQDWVGENSTGVSIWLSPPHLLRSSQAKIIVSELETIDDKKQLLNRAILFDTTKLTSINVANELATAFSEQELYYDSEEVVRSTPMFTSGYWSTKEWLEKIEKIIAESYQWDMVSTGADLAEAMRTLEIIRNGGDAPIGSNPLSCPLGNSPSSVMLRRSIEGKFIINCGNCGAELKRIMFAGDHCPYCDGVYEGC